jgi:hypothetical protein
MAVSEDTPTKHQHFLDILRTHTAITRGIIAKETHWCYPRYVYIDLNAGAANVTYLDGKTGETSGMMAARHLRQMGQFTYRAYLIESRPANCASLKAVPFIENDPDIRVICADNADALPALDAPLNAYGLLFSDTNTLNPDLDLLETQARRPEYQRIDFLIYLSGANYKRDQHSTQGEYLQDRLLRIKPHWCIQKPHGAHQKTFLLGSRWGGFGKFKQDLNFDLITAPRGRDWLEQVNLTRKERFLSRQAGLPIAPMRNTSGIPASEPCAPKRLSGIPQASPLPSRARPSD